MNICVVNWLSFAGFAIASIVRTSPAAVSQYTNFSLWQSAASPFTTITFADIPPSILSSQYASLGVTFTGGNDWIALSSGVFQLDGAGVLSSPDGFLEMSFSQPMTALAANYIGGVQFKLFNQGSLVYTSGSFFGFGSSHFAGLVSSQPFDSALLYQPDPGPGVDTIFIDSLYFGPPVPGPAALPLLALGVLIRRRERD